VTFAKHSGVVGWDEPIRPACKALALAAFFPWGAEDLVDADVIGVPRTVHYYATGYSPMRCYQYRPHTVCCSSAPAVLQPTHTPPSGMINKFGLFGPPPKKAIYSCYAFTYSLFAVRHRQQCGCGCAVVCSIGLP
jgi:hypothetical protein